MNRCQIYNVFFWAALCLLPIFAFPVSLDAQIPQATVELTDGNRLTIESLTVTKAGTIQGNGLAAPLNLPQILSIRTPLKPANRLNAPIQVYLEGSGVLAAKSIRLKAEKAQVELTDGLVAVDFRLESIRGISFDSAKSIDKYFADRSTDEDLVIVETSKGIRSVTGLLEGISDTHVFINVQNKSRKISCSKVVGIVTADLELAQPKGTVATVACKNKSKLSGRLLKLDQQLELMLPGESNLLIPSDQIVSVDIQSDALAYLSDLEPVETEFRHQFSPARTWRRNVSILGRELALKDDQNNKVVFKRGIGTVSYSRLVYENTNQFDELKATVGIDIETDGRGDCIMSIRGDGQELWRKRVRGNEALERISIPLNNVKQIELIVEPGKEFDLADHANWCEIRFLKKN